MSPAPTLATRQSALQWARQTIDRLDARLLLEAVSDCSSAALLAYPEVALSDQAWQHFQALTQRRAAGEPLAYLTGTAGFYGDLLHVSPAVLVPRPETEELVEWALALLAGTKSPRIADLGTGSGAIALALAGARSDAQIVAIDLSEDALTVAQANRDRLARINVECHCGNWFDGYPETQVFDLVVSNPPYIAAGDPHLRGDGVRFEPRLALTDNADGLSAYRQIAAAAVQRLKPKGWLLVEHGHDQAAAVAQIFAENGFRNIESKSDLSANPRMTAGQKTDGEVAGV